MNKIKDIFNIIGATITVIVLGFWIYNSYFGEPDFTILKSTKLASPVKNALFWYEKELEEITTDDIANHIKKDAGDVIPSLFEYIKSKGIITDRIEPLSETAKV